MQHCPVCGTGAGDPFFELRSVPVHIGIQYQSPKEARSCTRGAIALSYCRTCGHVFNSAFDPKLLSYDKKYENPLSFSPYFREFARLTAIRLIETYNIREKTVLELGCGKGEFLALLCVLGENRGVGFDPSFEEERLEAAAARRATVIPDFYSEKYASYQADLVCSRHVLEHLEDPCAFLRTARGAVRDRPGAVLYVEVPDGRYVLEELSIADLIYEHVSYFSPASLTYALRSSGFEVLSVRREFGGQFLTVEACPEAGGVPRANAQAGELEGTVSSFPDLFQQKLSKWRTFLQDLAAAGRTVVLWGAGAKGVMFLNLLAPESGVIRAAVDINPRKQGKAVAGTGHRIAAPSELKELAPDLILVMNPNYLREIRKEVEHLGLSAEVQAL